MKKKRKNPNVNGDRLHYASQVYVRKDGQRFYTTNLDGSNEKDCTIKYDRDYPYITVRKVDYRIDKMVAECYRPCPRDGRMYRIKHIDGNPLNCNADNLEWVKVVYNTNPVCDLCVEERRYHQKTIKHHFEVHNTGEVYVDGKKLHVGNSLFDPDTDLEVTIHPFVWVAGHRQDMDEIMAKAHYVHGDRDLLLKPVILHRDNDYMNFDSNNLEWVEANDPRYIEYYNAKVQAIRENNIDMNRRKGFPEFMQPKPITTIP